MPKRVAIGVVTSDKTAKTRRVEIPRQVRHPKYGKILHRKTICHVHDENERVAPGRHGRDRRVPAQSRTKRWELVRVVQKSRAVDLAAMRAAAKALEGELARRTSNVVRIAPPAEWRTAGCLLTTIAAMRCAAEHAQCSACRRACEQVATS